jgi:hypothetical protein
MFPVEYMLDKLNTQLIRLDYTVMPAFYNLIDILVVAAWRRAEFSS